MTFDLINIQINPHCIFDPSLVPIGLQLFKGDLNNENLTKLEHTHTHPYIHTPTRIHRQSRTHKFFYVFHRQLWTHKHRHFTIQMWTVLRVNRLTVDLVLHLQSVTLPHMQNYIENRSLPLSYNRGRPRLAVFVFSLHKRGLKVHVCR